MTMKDAPPPPVPADCDLQDFAFMPLHVARLRDSDLAAEEDPESCWYAVLLWAASWHQLPAASLPDNDIVLCKLIGLGRDLKTFRKNRDGMLRGFEKCADGRLYHPVVVEQALDAWRSKLGQRWRTECARIRKSNQRNNLEEVQPTLEDYVARDWPLSVPFMSLGQGGVVPRDMGGVSHGTCTPVPSDTSKKSRDIASKGQGQGQGQGQLYNTLPDGKAIDRENRDRPAEPPPDPNKQFWDDAKSYLGKSKSGLIGKWVADFGREAVAEAIQRSRAEGDGAGAIDPPAFIAGVLRAAARRDDADRKEREAAEASFKARHPVVERSDDEWRALLGDEEFERRKAMVR